MSPFLLPPPIPSLHVRECCPRLLLAAAGCGSSRRSNPVPTAHAPRARISSPRHLHSTSSRPPSRAATGVGCRVATSARAAGHVIGRHTSPAASRESLQRIRCRPADPFGDTAATSSRLPSASFYTSRPGFLGASPSWPGGSGCDTPATPFVAVLSSGRALAHKDRSLTVQPTLEGSGGRVVAGSWTDGSGVESLAAAPWTWPREIRNFCPARGMAHFRGCVVVYVPPRGIFAPPRGGWKEWSRDPVIDIPGRGAGGGAGSENPFPRWLRN